MEPGDCLGSAEETLSATQVRRVLWRLYVQLPVPVSLSLSKWMVIFDLEQHRSGDVLAFGSGPCIAASG